MQRKNNPLKRKSQMEDLVTIGIDMGGKLWATAIYDWNEGKNSYYALRATETESKEERCFKLVKELVKSKKKGTQTWQAQTARFVLLNFANLLMSTYTRISVHIGKRGNPADYTERAEMSGDSRAGFPKCRCLLLCEAFEIPNCILKVSNRHWNCEMQFGTSSYL